MASLREIRRKIKSVKSTEQITKAMKMVAAARLRRSQAAILAARPFAVKMEGLVRRLAADLRPGAQDPKKAAQSAMPAEIRGYFEAPREGGAGVVLVAADKGLCGAFNSNVHKAAVGWLKDNQGRPVFAAPVGRKSRDFLKRLSLGHFEILTELVGIFPKAAYIHAEILGKAVIDAYFQKKLSRVDVVYHEFKSISQQRLVRAQLLPIVPEAGAGAKEEYPEARFEPDRGIFLKELLPRHVKAQLYRILLESQAAELAARMSAMDSASKNAKELREDLNLDLNQQRQAMITKEIAEIVGGAEALAT
jgi:F-type H+-transporting ATPase subunit gamma